MKGNYFFKYISLVSEIGLIIGITTIGGVIVGIWIDGKLRTNGIFTILFLIFGLSGGITAVYRRIKELEDEGNKRS